MLSLRRWHYEHTKDYREFTDLFAKACEGDMTFFIKGMSYLTEMLSLDGIEGITELLKSLCPGTDSYNKAQFSNSNQQVHERLKDLFASTLNQDTVKEKLLHNNPFMCSTFYWMVFDDGFVKMGDLFSKTMMGENSSIWQKGFGGQFMRSMMLTSLEKACYTKGTWKTMSKNGVAKDIVSSTLQEAKKDVDASKSAYCLKKCSCFLIQNFIPTRYGTYSRNGWKPMVRIPFLPITLLL